MTKLGLHLHPMRFRVDPRDVPVEKAARRLGLTLDAFTRIREELFTRGFPRPDATTGHYDLVAIDAWMDARSNTDALTGGSKPRNAGDVFIERAARLNDGQ